MIAPSVTLREPFTPGTPQRRRSSRAFTIIELLVTMALLVVTIVAVGEVFDISAETAGRTAAHVEVMAASAALQQHLTELLSKIEPGLLVIESPEPTLARADIPGGPKYYRLRHDRLVFVASGSPGEFQSFTDPTRGTPDEPTWAPVQSSQALIYFGPGVPLNDTGDPKRPRWLDDENFALAASEWVFAHRPVLFALDQPNVPGWSLTGFDMRVFTDSGGMLDGGDLEDGYEEGWMDVVVSSPNTRADAAAFLDRVLDVPRANLLVRNARIAALWEPSWCPTSVTFDDPADRDHYTRNGFTFLPRVADFRIEWTDGRSVDPANGDYRTRWFGLRPDRDSSPDLSSPPGSINASVDYIPVRRQDIPYDAATDTYADTTPAEEDAFGLGPDGTNKIEWSYPASPTADQLAAYRAIWRADTWQFRPKALRFTYRIYDAGNRLRHTTQVDLDEDGIPDADPADTSRPAIVTRWGETFSVVLPIP